MAVAAPAPAAVSALQPAAEPLLVGPAPLAPAAVAVTLGMALDRWYHWPLAVSMLLLGVAVLCWGLAHLGRNKGLPLAYLALGGVALGAALHNFRRDFYPPDDIGWHVPPESVPAQLRGTLDEEPVFTPAPGSDPLRLRERSAHTRTVLRVELLRQGSDWVPVSGRVVVFVRGKLADLHAGDEVEAVGRLERISEPANPGEMDHTARLRDQGIRTRLAPRHGSDAVVLLRRGWPESPSGWLAIIRAWGQQTIEDFVPPPTRGVAAALLLGESPNMTRPQWDKYIRTGVIHVLVISGSHLVVLALGLGFCLAALGMPLRSRAVVIAVVVLAYALLTGGRPPAMRAAVTVGAISLALVLRRQYAALNLYALAWLVIILLNPADVSDPGCHMSFLATGVLYVLARVKEAQADLSVDPLDQLIAQSRPAWLRWLRGAGKGLLALYLETTLIWLLIAPLAASRFHMVPLVAIPLGPPLVWLTGIALMAGFALLVIAPFVEPLAILLGWLVHGSLAAADWLIDLADRRPVNGWYVGNVPDWWLLGFYLLLFVLLAVGTPVGRWRRMLAGGLAWLCLGLVLPMLSIPPAGLRVTFLAVGHGGCAVLETPDGRVLLYDTGSLTGPEVAQRQIAPFLWSRGIGRIDEVFLSHADLDHFNGLVDLLERFAVGQVSCTPTFADKANAPVLLTLTVLRERSIPIRILSRGDRLQAGAVTIEVLHPGRDGPAGPENVRSMVLRIDHAGHTLLLTGDLEGLGLAEVIKTPIKPIDVLMAPHHGSRRIDVEGLMKWARPQVIVACQGPPLVISAGNPVEAYQKGGGRYLGTWPHGAITLHSHTSGLVVETFVSRERLVVRTGR
jgi:competence protein ComEC